MVNKKKYKILKIAACPFPYPRGTPVRIFRIANSLSQLGHDVHVFTYGLGDKSIEVPFKIHRIKDIKTYKKLSPGPSYQKLLILDFLLLFKIDRFLKNNKIDVLHAHHYEALLIGLLLRRKYKIPLIYDAHTILNSELPHYNLGLPRSFKQSIARYIDNKYPKKADYIISVTDEIETLLISDFGIKQDKISVITNGVEFEHFTRSVGTDKQLQENKSLVYAGNLAPYQKIELLLEIFKKLLGYFDKISLKIVTQSNYQKDLSVAKKMGINEKINFINAGYDKLPDYLNSSDIALNTRMDGEGIPLKLLNYMAAGLPIVSFEGSARYLKHMETALLVKNGDIDSFVLSIKKLFDNPDISEQISKNAQSFAMENFSWEKSAGMVQDVYNKIVK